MFNALGRLLLLTLIFLVGACSNPNPTPELTDPIYNDLLQRSTLAKAASELAKKEALEIRKEIEEMPARDPAKSKRQGDLRKKERQFMVAEQDALYHEIRAEQRKAYAREEYLKAFNAGKPWPDPKDFESYRLQRKLENAPREWNDHIPKTSRYNKKSPEDQKKDLEEKMKSGGKSEAPPKH